MGNMRDVTAAVAAADDMPELRVIIGGAPVTLERVYVTTLRHCGGDACNRRDHTHRRSENRARANELLHRSNLREYQSLRFDLALIFSASASTSRRSA